MCTCAQQCVCLRVCVCMCILCTCVNVWQTSESPFRESPTTALDEWSSNDNVHRSAQHRYDRLCCRGFTYYALIKRSCLTPLIILIYCKNIIQRVYYTCINIYILWSGEESNCDRNHAGMKIKHANHIGEWYCTIIMKRFNTTVLYSDRIEIILNKVVKLQL